MSELADGESAVARVLRSLGVEPDAPLANESRIGLVPYIPLTPEQEAAIAERVQRSAEWNASLARIERERREHAHRTRLWR